MFTMTPKEKHNLELYNQGYIKDIWQVSSRMEFYKNLGFIPKKFLNNGHFPEGMTKILNKIMNHES